MQRREFLHAAGSISLAATLGQPGAANDSSAKQSSLTVERTETDRFVLEFTPPEPRSVRILQLTDTHFGNTDLVSQVEDKRSFAEIKRLVERERPDFIVHTGDFINNDKGPTISFEAVEVFDDLGVPWTHVLGNHDIGARSVPEFRKLMKHAAVGEFRGPDGDEHAFRLDLKRAGQSSPDCTLFCFYSGFRDPGRKVSRPQLDWFGDQTRSDAEQEIKSPALAMIHIPVVEFEKLRRPRSTAATTASASALITTPATRLPRSSVRHACEAFSPVTTTRTIIAEPGTASSSFTAAWEAGQPTAICRAAAA